MILKVVKEGNVHLLDGVKLDLTNMYRHACLSRVFRAVLEAQEIKFEFLENSEVESIELLDLEKEGMFQTLLYETMEWRCNDAADKCSFKNVIRQLPIEVVMKESEELLQKNMVHAISRSIRGGYDLLINGKYTNSSLYHYSYVNTKVWD